MTRKPRPTAAITIYRWNQCTENNQRLKFGDNP